MRYKFRCFNNIYKSMAKIICPFQNFFITIAVFMLTYYLIGRLTILIGVEDYFLNENVFSVVRKLMFICSAISVLIYLVCKKGVFLYDDCLVIAKYTITKLNWKPRITVNYADIERVNVNYIDLHFSRHRFHLVSPCADEAYNVELTLKNGKKYFFSIENQEEFCDNVNMLIDKEQ